MNEEDVVRFIESFPDVRTDVAYDYRFFFYGDEEKLPFATLANTDAEYDSVSNLSRPGVFRLNIGVKPETYARLFGPRPPKAGPSGVVDTGHDFTALDQLLPHPTYAPQSWVCVLSPSAQTFQEEVKPLLEEAYALAVKRGR